MESSLEVRPQYLEAREKANTKEIVGLKTENAELQTKVFDLKRQNLQAAEKMMEMETCCKKMMEKDTCYKKMENDLKSILGFRDLIENRLTHLESNMTGFTDNHDRLSNLETELQTKVFDLKRQNLQTAEKMMEMEICYKKMENDSKSIFGFRDIIENRLTHLESNMTGFTDNHDRLSNLETDINQAKLDMTNHCQSLTQKVETFQREGRQPKSQMEGACAVPDTLVKKLDTLDLARQKQAMQGVGVTHRLDMLERQASEILNKVWRLDEIGDQISQSITCVFVTPSQRLKTGRFSKLDKCEAVNINGGCFDTGSCCFNPHVTGDYLVSVLYRQANDGVIEVNAMDGNSEVISMGRTAQHSELSECINIFRLAWGQSLWLKAKRYEGNAYIYFCNLTCWLLHPIT